MKTYLDKAHTRGHSLYNWLDSYHTFSFDEYYNPDRMNFGALRVLNDDTVAPGSGFGKHPHKNMEVVSIPLYGALKHGDSQNNMRTIVPGQIQVMSAGSGIYHSEMNASDEQEVKFLQIWIMPRQHDTPPSYQDYDIRPLLHNNELRYIIAPDGSTPATINQDAWFALGTIDANKIIRYNFHNEENGVYLFLLEGEVRIGDITLFTRDGLGITDVDAIEIETIRGSRLLLIEIPL